MEKFNKRVRSSLNTELYSPGVRSTGRVAVFTAIQLMAVSVYFRTEITSAKCRGPYLCIPPPPFPATRSALPALRGRALKPLE